MSGAFGHLLRCLVTLTVRCSSYVIVKTLALLFAVSLALLLLVAHWNGLHYPYQHHHRLVPRWWHRHAFRTALEAQLATLTLLSGIALVVALRLRRGKRPSASQARVVQPNDSDHRDVVGRWRCATS
jgi:hypothetical protein